MSRKRHLFIFLFTFFCMSFMLIFSNVTTKTTYGASGYSFLVLSNYSKSLNIGGEFYLLAVASNGKAPSFSSSNSAVASVNAYGKVTAKKAGNALITAKVKGGEASCKVVVSKTNISINQTTISLQNGYGYKLAATASTGHAIKWKSNRTSIATVDSNGNVIAKKPGTATITASTDKTTVSCKVIVNAPTIKLSHNGVSLYRKQMLSLSVSSTSKSTPKWKSNKKSVVTVDKNGMITARKHGTARITVTVDGVSKSCEVTIKKPVIQFSQSQVTLAVGQVYTPSVTVSSQIAPVYSSSNMNVASVDTTGHITARQPGKAYIYASEDGTKVSLIVTVK
jgi:uncharacterized protein YjdB